jgi:hypothetical protein
VRLHVPSPVSVGASAYTPFGTAKKSEMYAQRNAPAR